jgi:hypothetical protein
MATEAFRMKIDMELLALADKLATVKIENSRELEGAICSMFGHGTGQFLVSQVRRHSGEEGEPVETHLLRWLTILVISGFVWGWRYRKLEEGNGEPLKPYTLENFVEC